MKNAIKYNLSVIIACYNPDLQKLKNTINSIINQRDVSFEIIIADDGSTNDYKEYVKEYFVSLSFIDYKLSFLIENQGTVKNILEAVKLSDAEFIKTISPGDYLYNENSLQEYLRLFIDKKADLVFGRAQYFTPQNELLHNSAPENTVVFKNLFIKRNVLNYHDYILGAAVAARKELFKYLSALSGRVKYLEDVPLTFLALLNEKRVVASNQKLIWYEYGLGISTNSKMSVLLNDDYNAFFQYLEQNYAKEAELSVKMYKAKQVEGKCRRLFRKFLISPFYFFYLLRRKISNTKFKQKDIELLKQIIKVS